MAYGRPRWWTFVGKVDFKRRVPARPPSQERYPGNASVDRSELRSRAPAGKRSVALCVVSERGAPRTAPGFSRMIERAGIAADLGIKVHAHMLPHACGYKLAGDGVDTGPCKRTSATAISRIRHGTRPWRLAASKDFGEPDGVPRLSRPGTPPTPCLARRIELAVEAIMDSPPLEWLWRPRGPSDPTCRSHR